MNELKNNGRGIFYGIIGIATLVVAIVGATFAYFTATAANNVITGNMASVKLQLAVTKKTTAEDTIGLIPMSNGMVQAAVYNTSNKGICIDDNGNPVCQIYKITLTNASSAGQFVDGYVALRGGSGTPQDYTSYVTGAKFKVDDYKTPDTATGVGTTMRWAQVFCTEASGSLSTCSTAGTQKVGITSAGADVSVTFSAIGDADNGANTANIRTENALISANATKGVLKEETILGNSYNVIGTNYIRVSNHTWVADLTAPESYKRADDVTSALVFNNNIGANATSDYYIVVWLTENGQNQTAGQTDSAGAALTPAAASFFMGNVTFISAQGSEVSATFTDYTRVQSNNA